MGISKYTGKCSYVAKIIKNFGFLIGFDQKTFGFISLFP